MLLPQLLGPTPPIRAVPAQVGPVCLHLGPACRGFCRVISCLSSPANKSFGRQTDNSLHQTSHSIHWTLSLQIITRAPTCTFFIPQSYPTDTMSTTTSSTKTTARIYPISNPPSTILTDHRGTRQNRKYEWRCCLAVFDKASHAFVSGAFWSDRDHHLMYQRSGSDCYCNDCGEEMTPYCKIFNSMGTTQRMLGGFSIRWERLAPAG